MAIGEAWPALTWGRRDGDRRGWAGSSDRRDRRGGVGEGGGVEGAYAGLLSELLVDLSELLVKLLQAGEAAELLLRWEEQHSKRHRIAGRNRRRRRKTRTGTECATT